MSWIERELKRRAAKPKHKPGAAQPQAAVPELARMQQLWAGLLEANNALPEEIRLRVDSPSSAPAFGAEPVYLGWLRAPNGAALGFTGDALRYLWTDGGRGRSHNFWLRWDVHHQRPVLIQRTDSKVPPTMTEVRFDDRRLGYMVKCLVLGKRITASSVRRKRLWLF